MNPFLENEESPEKPNTIKNKKDFTKQSMEQIGEILLENKMMLSSLELYTECMERGIELQNLRDFFSNPTNFESQMEAQVNGSLYKMGSLSSFDSFEIGQQQLSDDSRLQTEDRVAVLEFELRKAKETIKNLRTSLTELSERANDQKFQSNKRTDNEQTEHKILRLDENKNPEPYECRALNFLVNEYLLEQNYTLSSITFCEENEDQDFEDWHDVGLNISKPLSLLSLYRCNTKVSDENNDDLKKEISLQKELIVQFEETVEKLQKENKSLLNTKSELKNDEMSCDSIQQQQLNKMVEAACQTEFQLSASVSQKSLVDKNKENLIQKDDEPSDVFQERYVPVSFWKKLTASNSYTLQVEDQWLKQEVSNICTTSEEFVSCVARSIPKILPIVLLAKRDRLLPILLATASLHEDKETRNKMLNLLFNLIKKPNALQRQMILQGCVSYAKHAGKLRTEEELLPQCWEQIGHKHAERRQLIAETCGAISPYLRAEIRSSLIYSILEQIMQEERTKEVKHSVVKSLSIVFVFLSETEKYRKAEECLWKVMNDQDCTDIVAKFLFPSFCLFSIQQNSLCQSFGNKLLQRFDNHASNEVLNEPNCCRHLSTLVQYIHYVFVYAIMSVMSEDSKVKLKHEFEEVLKSQSSEKEVATEENDNEDDIIKTCLGLNDDKIAYFKDILNDKLSHERADQSDSENLDVISWLKEDFLPILSGTVVKINVRNKLIVKKLIDLISGLCIIFGKIFTEKMFKPFLCNLFVSDESNFATSLLPVYAVGVLRNCIKMRLEGSEEEFHHFLLQALERNSCADEKFQSVVTSFRLLRDCDPSLNGLLAKILVSSSQNKCDQVRARTATLLACLSVNSVEAKLIDDVVLPTLIRLSLDDCINVRLATIATFSTIAENHHVSGESMEQVIKHLGNMMTWSIGDDVATSDAESMLSSHQVQMRVALICAENGTSVHPRFRDQFLIPHLSIISATSKLVLDVEKKMNLCNALVEAYTNILCCFINESLLQGSCLPALKCLLTELNSLPQESVSHLIDSVKGLIEGVEARLSEVSTISDNDNKTKTEEQVKPKPKSRNPFQKLF